MKYDNITSAVFRDRPNRFIAEVDIEGHKETVHVIRTSVSLGGDCDTLTCIAGGMAEAFCGVPDDFKKECEDRLPKDALKVLHDFSKWRIRI